MAGLAIITEACIGVEGPACVDVCPVQCIYEFDPATNVLFSEDEAGSGEIANTHAASLDAIAIFSDTLLYVNVDECTSCTALLRTRRLSRRGDLLGGARSRREPGYQVQRLRPEPGTRPHLLRPTDAGRVR